MVKSKVECVCIGKLEEVIKRFHLWDHRTFWKADCIEWKAESPYWCYTYPKTEKEDELISAFITKENLTDEEMRQLETLARFLSSVLTEKG